MAAAISAGGAKITRTVLPMFAILTVGANPTQVALLAMLGVAPGLVVSLVGGGIVDRNACRPLMIGADLFRAALILTIPVAAMFDLMSMPQIYLVAAAIGAANTLFGIADNTYLPTLVRPDDLVAANARLETTDAVAEGFGPWLGGVLVGLIGAPAALLIDALTYLWSAAFLGMIDRTEVRKPQEGAAGRGMFDDAVAGLRACLFHPLIARILLAETLVSLTGGFFMALYMVIALVEIGLSPATIGLIIGIGGIGSLGGAFLAPALERRLGTFRTLLLCLSVAGLWSISLPLSMVFTEFAIPLLISDQLVGDAFMTAFLIIALSLRQRVLPEQTMGRANATFHLANGIALVVGSIIAGLLSLALSVPTVSWLAISFAFAAIPVLGSGRVPADPSIN